MVLQFSPNINNIALSWQVTKKYGILSVEIQYLC